MGERGGKPKKRIRMFMGIPIKDLKRYFYEKILD